MLNSLSNIQQEYNDSVGEIVRKRTPTKVKSIRTHPIEWDGDLKHTFYRHEGFNKEFSVLVLDVVCCWNGLPRDTCSFNSCYQAVEIMKNYDEEQQSVLATPSVFNPTFYIVKDENHKALFRSSINRGTYSRRGGKK